MRSDPVSAANALLACSAAERVIWLSSPAIPLTIDLIAELKRRSDSLILSNPLNARLISECALLVAEHIPDTALALALARWAHANWQAYHDPNAAIESYQLALHAYRAANDSLSIARLLGNLVFTYSDCGRFPEAEHAYQEAAMLYHRIGETASYYLLRLEQNYGWLLHNQGQYERALGSYEQATLLAQQLNQPIIELELLVNNAITLGTIGRLDESEAGLLQAHGLAQAHQQEVTIARIELDLGWLTTARGQPARALRHFQAAHERFMALENQMELGTVLLWEAMLLERIGALREARWSYAQAAAQFESLAMLPMLGNALVDQAAACRRYGLFPQALALLDKAEVLWEKLDQPLWQARVHCERAALALAQDDQDHALMILQNMAALTNHLALRINRDLLLADAHSMRWQRSADQHSFIEAQQAYERVQHNAVANGDRWAQRQALRGLGLLVCTTAPGHASGYLEAAAALDDITRQTFSVEELRAGFQDQTADILPMLAELAVEQGQIISALVYAWRAKGSALLDLLYRAEQAQTDSADDLLIQQLREQIASKRWQSMREAANQAPDALRERADRDIAALEQQLVSVRRRSNHSLTETAAIVDDNAHSLLAHMQADWLIEYLPCGERILAICANPFGEYHSVWISPLTALLDCLDELHLCFQNVLVQAPERRLRFREAWLAECRPLLQQLYDLLFAPLEPWLSTTSALSRLLIAPCDPLYLVPFAALWDGRQYLTERYEISFIPSGAVLAAAPHEQANGQALIIACSAAGRLARVADEVHVAISALPDAVGLIDNPHALRYLEGMPVAPQVVHIATHSILRDDAPIFSALQLTDSMLSVEQCYNLPLRGTQLVTLSSCVTGAGMDSGGSLLAFQSAFFVAGARHVLSSLWQIDDQITARWMEHFYHYYAAGHTPATALHHVQRDLLAQPDMGHPVFWAAFICSRR